MSIIERLQRAISTGGWREVIRKVLWKIIYIVNGYRTFKFVTHTPCEYGLNRNEERDMRVIISLTSFSPRLPSLHKCLKSLLLQEVKADKIIVYFGNDVTRDALPDTLLNLEKYGIEYRFDKFENLRSYKKFYYAIQEFPKDIVITVDDDVYYPKYWLASFLETHEKHPDCVCAWRVHLMRINENGLLPYNLWIDQYRNNKEPSFSLFPTGVGGILYPPGSLDSRVLDKKTFVDLCFTCDDIWLKVMCLLKGTKTVWVPNNEVSFYEVEKEQEYALFHENVGESANDVVLARVMKAFEISPKDFFSNI